MDYVLLQVHKQAILFRMVEIQDYQNLYYPLNKRDLQVELLYIQLVFQHNCHQARNYLSKFLDLGEGLNKIWQCLSPIVFSQNHRAKQTFVEDCEREPMCLIPGVRTM